MTSKRYRIVVGIDLTEYCEIVLERALDQAARHDSPDLHFVFVREKMHRKRSSEELVQRLGAIVYPALHVFNRHGRNWRARLHVRTGKAPEQIAGLAQDLLADLIVIGHFGLHHPHAAEVIPARVLLGAPCATLVVGMPRANQRSPICAACAAVREDSDGERWFCESHAAREHVMSPMTEWSGGGPLW
jgi:nucleotide-binding universal stress UspA family protein